MLVLAVSAEFLCELSGEKVLSAEGYGIWFPAPEFDLMNRLEPRIRAPLQRFPQEVRSKLALAAAQLRIPAQDSHQPLGSHDSQE